MTNKEMHSGDSRTNKNDVNVNNNFSLSIHFGDSLNLLALIVGFFLLIRMSKQHKSKKG